MWILHRLHYSCRIKWSLMVGRGPWPRWAHRIPSVRGAPQVRRTRPHPPPQPGFLPAKPLEIEVCRPQWPDPLFTSTGPETISVERVAVSDHRELSEPSVFESQIIISGQRKRIPSTDRTKTCRCFGCKRTPLPFKEEEGKVPISCKSIRPMHSLLYVTQ